MLFELESFVCFRREVPPDKSMRAETGSGRDEPETHCLNGRQEGNISEAGKGEGALRRKI